MTTLATIPKPLRFPSPGEDSSARLAFDVAAGLKPLAEVADDYGTTPAALKQLLLNDAQFVAQVKEMRQVWNSPLSAAQRVRIKTAIMAEDGLVDIWKLMTNEETHPSVRLDVHRHLSKLADVEPRKDIDTGPKFSLTLNLGGGEQIVADVQAIPVQQDADLDLPEYRHDERPSLDIDEPEQL